ncbi:MAG: 2,3-bisphosphoglycerate-dependent phosphoglycerate mutase [Chlamydiia bacterium]|nr:2,3-bisphosphoglycerate-dependent phosphoglycerate mutase [Chlamydiia bacterium]MCH9618660.1 2,3-bisphosphoglycerate-dependent phosphoglycerate mutase [Chlamydiia bacterium]MCH9623851.1 2,3-bisphosphoglycerate-dependent phosphoglycerate mutase [Chlamydiia bacterium]
MGKLILLRHGNSTWNQKNIFTGWVDISLSKRGVEEATAAGKLLSKITFDAIYTSCLSRAQMTLQLAMLENEDRRSMYLEHDDKRYFHGIDKESSLMVHVSEALNERFYGDLQGKEKNAFKEKVGEELFTQYRRSYDIPPPNGESLEMTIKRTLPYFDKEILPRVKAGETVLIVAHGNSLRGIVKEVMDVSDSEIVAYEIATGTPLIFSYENNTFVEGKI